MTAPNEVSQPPMAPATAASNKPRTGFLEDHRGQPSSMRLMSMVALTASIMFALITLLHKQAAMSENGVFITSAFLIAAFAPKALQKFAEAKIP